MAAGAQESELLAKARQLIPAEGNDFGAVARGGPAEHAFRARVAPLLHPQFETVWPAAGDEPDVTAGLEATMSALHRIGSAFERLVAIPEAYVEVGDRVLVLLRREGLTSDGFEFREEGAVIYVFENGLLRRMRLYSERGGALAHIGITVAEAQERGFPPR